MVDSAIINYIVEELAKDPFNLEYNRVAFNSFQGEPLLLVLKDVIIDIDPTLKDTVDTSNWKKRERLPLNFDLIIKLLSVLKYEFPENEEDLALWKEQMEDGQPDPICNIIAWLLKKREDHKMRAYLAKFLVRIDIPDCIMDIEEVEQTYQNCEEMIEEFVRVHKRHQAIHSKNRRISEYLKDINSTEHDQNSVKSKIEKFKTKYSDCEKAKELFSLAAQKRREKEKSRELGQVRGEEEAKLAEVESVLIEKAEEYEGMKDKVEQFQDDFHNFVYLLDRLNHDEQV